MSDNKKQQADVFDDEKDVLLDHNYDGIRELDNHMPRWWLFGFYFTIIFAVLYLMFYHITGWGPSSEEEYKIQMANAVVPEKVDSGTPADWASLEFLSDEAQLAEGKVLYNQICNVCHGANGEGLVGPNLTDEYWITGCDLPTMMTSIKSGFPAKGMPAYGGGAPLDANQLQLVASYIHSLEGTNPANAKPHDPARETACE